MRELSATLKAAQESMELEPKVRITLSDPAEVEADIVIEEDRILQMPSQEESSDSQTAEFILDNSDGYFTDLDLQGWLAVLELGLVTESGAEYSAVAPLKVLSQYLPSAPGVLEYHLSLIGIPNLLAEDKASKDYLHHWSDAKTVKAMITEIADGRPVEGELTEEQATYDSYIDLKDGIYGAGQRRTIEGTVTKLAFRLKKTGLPTGTNVTFRIRDAETEDILASKTFPIASIGEAPAFCEVTLDPPVEVDQAVWIYCEHTEGTATKYISVSYNSYAIKPEEWFMQVNAAGDPVTEWADRDCAYRYKYTGAGIDCWARGTTPETYCQAYAVVYGLGTGGESLINTYLPKDAFRIYEGQSRLDTINRLLGYTDCEKIIKADGKIHVFVPKSSEPFDTVHSLESGHSFYSKANREALVIPNRIVVKSLKTDEDQHSGEATSTVSYGLLPITGAPIRTSLVDDAQGGSIAAAKISRLEMAAQRGAASVPMNLGAEVFDYDKVTDSRAGDERVGNLGYLRRSYTPGTTWKMDFSFGRLPLKRVPGTRPSLLPEARVMPEPTLDEAILRWGMIKPSLEIVESNFEEVWKSFDGIIQILNEIISGLGWFEGQTPTDEQITSGLLGYLKNLVEDTTPQLGGNLDTNGKYIEFGDFKIFLTADRMWFLTPTMVFEITATGVTLQKPLDMSSEKIVELGAPDDDADAATKKFVLDNAGVVKNTTVDTTLKSVGTNYQNTTGKLLFVTVSVVLYIGENASLRIGVSSPPATEVNYVQAGDADEICLSMSGIVPVGYYWKVVSAGSMTKSTTYTLG